MKHFSTCLCVTDSTPKEDTALAMVATRLGITEFESVAHKRVQARLSFWGNRMLVLNSSASDIMPRLIITESERDPPPAVPKLQ